MYRSVIKLGALCTLLVWMQSGLASPDPEKVVGPEECAECHDVETGIWEETHHAITYESMPDSDDGVDIGDKLGIDDVVEAELCQTCHLTLQGDAGDAEVIAGVSCESCHGAGRDWVEVHSVEDKTEEEQTTLWAESEAAGMIRPGNVYAFAKNCLGCHIVAQEELVNTGGHAAGSEFNLVTWSQGEVRHNTFTTPENNEASPERKRLMAVMGLVAELEGGIAALQAVENADGEYAAALVARMQRAQKELAEIAGNTDDGNVQSINAAVADMSFSAPLDAGTAGAAISALSEAAQALNTSAADLSGLDALIAAYGEYKGDPVQ